MQKSPDVRRNSSGMSAKQILAEIRRCNDKNYTPSVSRYMLGRLAFKKGVVPPKRCSKEIFEGWKSACR